MSRACALALVVLCGCFVSPRAAVAKILDRAQAIGLRKVAMTTSAPP